jgi:predicted amino acid racemase
MEEIMRTPSPSEIEEVVRYADISLNSEAAVIQSLSREAVKQTLELPNLELYGLGTNFGCYGSVIPTVENGLRGSITFVLVLCTNSGSSMWISGM